ncbi:hypothetical protein ABFP60_20415 [Clostridioides difficile]
MKYVIFLILISIIIFMYFYYEKKLTIVKKRLLRTSNQYNNIRNEYRSALSKNQNVDIQFVTPTIQSAITNNKVTVFLAPLTDSPKVKTLDIKMEVKILDSAIIDDKTWFYVNLPVDSTHNCRGWINKDDFSLVYSQSKDISPNYK